MSDVAKQETYVVKGRSGINFLVTLDFEKAKKLQEDLNGINGDKGYIEHWINEKHIFTS